MTGGCLPYSQPPATLRRDHDMSFAPVVLRSHDLEHLTGAEEALLLGNARMLWEADRAGRLPMLLRGKHLGLLCDDEFDSDAGMFRDAAVRLGARVSHIRISQIDSSEPHLLRQTARMLGRLYDGIGCQGVPHDLVRAIRADAGVPVYHDISSARHPAARLMHLLPEATTDLRPVVLLTVLASTL